MAIIKIKYTKEELKDLGPLMRERIGFDTYILGAVKPGPIKQQETYFYPVVSLWEDRFK
jgi:hypothetical protein